MRRRRTAAMGEDTRKVAIYTRELLGSAFTSTYARRAGTTAAAVAISLISTAITMKNTY